MSPLEEAARKAGERWKDGRDKAKAELREYIPQLLHAGKNMTEIADILQISRTTLYYMLDGRDGKRARRGRKPSISAVDPGISTHDGPWGDSQHA